MGVVTSQKSCPSWWQWLVVFLGDAILCQVIELTVKFKNISATFLWTICLTHYLRNSELLNNCSKLIYQCNPFKFIG